MKSKIPETCNQLHFRDFKIHYLFFLDLEASFFCLPLLLFFLKRSKNFFLLRQRRDASAHALDLCDIKTADDNLASVRSVN